MSDNNSTKQAISLFKTIQKALTKMPINKLNDKIMAFIKAKDDNQSIVHRVVCTVAEENGITPEAVYNSTKRGVEYDSKIISWMISLKIYGINANTLAREFGKYPNCIHHAKRKFDSMDIEKRKKDRMLMTTYNKCVELVKEQI
jgi:hypothetical protein